MNVRDMNDRAIQEALAIIRVNIGHDRIYRFFRRNATESEIRNFDVYRRSPYYSLGIQNCQNHCLRPRGGDRPSSLPILIRMAIT